MAHLSMTMLCFALVLGGVAAHSLRSQSSPPSLDLYTTNINVIFKALAATASDEPNESTPMSLKAKVASPGTKDLVEPGATATEKKMMSKIKAIVAAKAQAPNKTHEMSQTVDAGEKNISKTSVSNKTNLEKKTVSKTPELPKAHLDKKVKSVLSINPPLKDVSSDKKFFGPPFPADYPEDKRPVVQKSILDKLKGPEQPYPKLQGKAEYDKDFVSDENSDRGHWDAQFEYDALRKRLADKDADVKKAEKRADEEGRDAKNAEGKADKASKDAADAKKNADDASAEEGVTGKDAEAGKPSEEALEKLKGKVASAEAKYEKEKKEFAECTKKLEAAKKVIEDLKAEQAATEKELDSKTKFWAEENSASLNLKKARVESATTRRHSAEVRLTVAKTKKKEMDERLAVQKVEHEGALKALRKQKFKLSEAKKDLDKATLTLQKLRGYKVPKAKTDSLKSSAPVAAKAFLMLMIAAAHFL